MGSISSGRLEFVASDLGSKTDDFIVSSLGSFGSFGDDLMCGSSNVEPFSSSVGIFRSPDSGVVGSTSGIELGSPFAGAGFYAPGFGSIKSGGSVSSDGVSVCVSETGDGGFKCQSVAAGVVGLDVTGGIVGSEV